MDHQHSNVNRNNTQKNIKNSISKNIKQKKREQKLMPKLKISSILIETALMIINI